MAVLYHDSDGDLGGLRGKIITLFGYGAQGRAQALNLRDSGAAPRIFLRPGSRHRADVAADGLILVSDPAEIRGTDIAVILTPDTTHSALWQEVLAPQLAPTVTLVFAHGFSIHYKKVIPPATHDVVLVAPLGQGGVVRSEFAAGRGIPGLIAVAQDASGRALTTALAYAKGIGALRPYAIQTTFKEETEIDLFAEQVILCGGLKELIRRGFATLVEAGFQPEIAYYSCLKEIRIAALMAETGVADFMGKISEVARYGAMTRGPRVIDERVGAVMRDILAEITSGRFAAELTAENVADADAQLAQERHDLIDEIHQKLKKLESL